MRPLIALVIVAVVGALLFSGCKEEEVVQPPPPPPPDPGWPMMSLQDAAIQYQLEEAHYHIRKGRHAAPNSFGSEYEMPLAMGYTQWAFANAAVAADFPSDDAQVQSRRETLITGAITTADHLILEHGARFDVPYGHTPRCKWCRHPMPKSLTHWPIEAGRKVVECPKCGARDSFPVGLVLTCSYCQDRAAGTAAAGATCPTCRNNWRALRKQCSNCGLEVPVTRRQGETCPRCRAKWNFDTPFGNWDTRAPTRVPDAVSFDVSTEEGDMRMLGRLRPKKAAPAAAAAPAAGPAPGAPPGGAPGMPMEGPPAPPAGPPGGGGMGAGDAGGDLEGI